VESYLNPAKGKTADPTVGLGLCMELGLLYLEGQRFKEADAFFTRLETTNEPRSYRTLGELGRGITFALNDPTKESNKRFRDVFGPPFTEKKGGFNPMEKQEKAALKRADDKLPPAIAAVKQNPRWRYWLSRARWYNNKNGLSESEVSFWVKH